MKLNAGDIKALKASAEHWRRLATGKAREEEGIYGGDCAACARWRRNGIMCANCPLRQCGCCNTLWSQARDMWIKHGRNSRQFRAAARKVLAFIKSKIPKGGRK